MSGFGHSGPSHRGPAPALDGATGWLGSAPLPPDALRGRVVLYVFWTYTCINWLRMLPYVRAWAARYRDRGLLVIGIHTPEFSFEQDPDNVRRAIGSSAIEFPVALDGDYVLWRSFDNHYWPARYLADGHGVIRHEHFGEGRYGETDRAIRVLLAEAGVTGPDSDALDVRGTGVEAPADWTELESQETYLGHDRADRFASDMPMVLGASNGYAPAGRLDRDEWTLSGAWTVVADRITADRPHAGLAVRFHARDLNVVMAPTDPGLPVRFRVSLDDRAPGDAHGSDLGPAGSGVLAEPRMHQLLRQPPPIADRTARLTFLDAGAAAYVLTFG
jgi:thioredoxin family protein